MRWTLGRNNMTHDGISTTIWKCVFDFGHRPLVSAATGIPPTIQCDAHETGSTHTMHKGNRAKCQRCTILTPRAWNSTRCQHTCEILAKDVQPTSIHGGNSFHPKSNWLKIMNHQLNDIIFVFISIETKKKQTLVRFNCKIHLIIQFNRNLIASRTTLEQQTDN